MSVSRGGVCGWSGLCVCVCVFELGKKKEEAGLLLRMLPVRLLSPPQTLLACCFSKHEGPEMIQVEPTVTTAHPGAKVKTTTFRHTQYTKPAPPIIFQHWSLKNIKKKKNLYYYIQNSIILSDVRGFNMS